MQWYEQEVGELVARLAATRVRDPVVAYGSSSFTLWRTLARDLQDARVVNAAFGGSTLEACDHFFERIVVPLEPAALLIYAGDNDLGDGRSPDDVLAAYRRLVAKVDRLCGPIPLGFLSIKPSPARFTLLDRIRRTNDLVRAETEARPNGFFVPLFEFMVRNGQPRSEFFVADGLHLSPAGYRLWTQLLEPFREQLFAAR
jgi:lysophospholipase L1-like esterase